MSVGWHENNPKNTDFSAEGRGRKSNHPNPVGLGPPRRKSVPVETDAQVRLLLEAGTPVVTLVAKTWLLHVKEVLRTTPDENLAMIADSVRFLKDHRRLVVYDAEHAFDGFKDKPEYALATWQAAE